MKFSRTVIALKSLPPAAPHYIPAAVFEQIRALGFDRSSKLSTAQKTGHRIELLTQIGRRRFYG
jgi:hypothetical protein